MISKMRHCSQQEGSSLTVGSLATHQLVIYAVQEVCIPARSLQLLEAERRPAQKAKAPRNDLECLHGARYNICTRKLQPAINVTCLQNRWHPTYAKQLCLIARLQILG